MMTYVVLNQVYTRASFTLIWSDMLGFCDPSLNSSSSESASIGIPGALGAFIGPQSVDDAE
jgi:hypothetical protein